MDGWNTLVQAEDLAARLADAGAMDGGAVRGDVARGDVVRRGLVVADCRVSLADRDAGPRLYAESHIPGAIRVELETDLSDHRKTGQGRHPWPDAADFTARLGAWGIARDTQVVAYDDGDGAFAARLWFMLRALGHERVAVLDGGWARWTQLGLPVDARVPQPVAVEYATDSFDAGRLLDAEGVQSRVEAGDLLLDARAAPRFRGEVEPLDRVAGHVPGARNRPYADNLADGRFKSPAALRREFEAALEGRDPARLVAMCGSGVTACHHLLAMEHAGLRGAKLFTGSWSGWISDPSRPVATGP
jgi:thiosulfate/3-mercaptopyruvate sulfurtransferase